MAGKINLEEEAAATIEKSLVSDCVQLCITEGTKPSGAYVRTKRKLLRLRELKNWQILTNTSFQSKEQRKLTNAWR